MQAQNTGEARVGGDGTPLDDGTLSPAALSATGLAVLAHADYGISMPARHRFPMAKFAALKAHLEVDVGQRFRFVDAPLASRPQLERAHAEGYVGAVLDLRLEARAQARIGLPFGPALVRRSRRAVGGTLAAARIALRDGAAANSAGGSHHAHAAWGAGFCVFNDVAVAVRTLVAEGHIRRAVVIDLDVHQGDGTADILGPGRAVDEAFTFSMHCASNYPPAKRLSHLDVALPPATGDDAYLDALRAALPKVLDAARAQLAFFVAGVDTHVGDRLGRLALSDAGIAERERMVVAACVERGLPVCGVLGGGYADSVATVVRLHVCLFEALAGIRG